MIFKKICSLISGIAAASVLLSCTATAPVSQQNPAPETPRAAAVDLKAAYAQLGAGKVMTLDPAASNVRIYVFRAGQAAKVGHNHVLSAPQFTGLFFLPPSGAAQAQFDLEFRLDQLEVDNPAHRAALGPAFASPVSPEAAVRIRENMLSNDIMQAERFPLVRVHSLEIAGEAPKFTVKVQVEMHGKTREMWVPLNVEGLPDRLSVTGSFSLRQTDFGVQPLSMLGGMIAVKDEVIIEFKLAGA